MYILHQTVIVVVAHSLKPAHLDPALEGALLVLVTASACFLGYEAIRRVRILRPLFGLPIGDRQASNRRGPSVAPATRIPDLQ